jgi:hypothetical protein
METSFVAGPDGFSTMVHVSLIDMKLALTIWEHHILPIPLDHGLYLNMGPAEYTHLAVTQDHKLYKAMTRAEFNTCRQVGEFYLCDRGLVVTKASKSEAPPPPWKDPALCLIALFARRFTLAKETCRTTIGGTDSAMRMVLPNSFGSYAGDAHRGLVTCHRDEAGKLETKSFTASGLTKITLPNRCTAETDTHIFAAADDGFDRAENDYIVAYVWPFDPLTLTPGLDTKKFSEILRRNLTNLANNTRHNIPLEIALQAVGAEYGVPMNLNEVMDNLHYVTGPIVVLILFVGGTVLVIMGVMIARRSTETRHQYQMMNYMHKRQDAFERTLDYLEEREAKMNPERPEKAKAPQTPWDRVTAGPPPYTGQGRGRPPVSSGPGCPLGATSSLIAEMQEHARTTKGHSLGMNETELHGEGARALGAFDLGRNQEAARNYPRAPAAINMQEMMEQK